MMQKGTITREVSFGGDGMITCSRNNDIIPISSYLTTPCHYDYSINTSNHQ